MKIYRCRDCGSQFELENVGRLGREYCVDCDGPNVTALNVGFEEFDPNESRTADDEYGEESDAQEELDFLNDTLWEESDQEGNDYG